MFHIMRERPRSDKGRPARLGVEELERRDVPAAHAAPPGLALGLAQAAEAAASQPPTVPAFEDGDMVLFKMNNQQVIGVDHGALEDKVAIALYAFGFPPNQLQPDVLAKEPGDAGYRPWWEVFQVTVLDGRDLSTNPYTSEEEILQAQADGKVMITETDFIFLCQVLPGVGKND